MRVQSAPALAGVEAIRRALTTLVLLTTACGGPSGPLAVEVEGPPRENLPTYLSSPDLPDHVRAFAASIAVEWGASPGVLDGWRIVFRQTVFSCGDVSYDHALGCTDPRSEEIHVLAWGSACPEATVIAHEVGHVVLGDPEHRDRRWRDRGFWARLLDDAKQSAPHECDLSRFVRENEDHGEDDREEDGEDD